MPFATTDDGVRLHYEETGAGTPILFVHEFAGDHRSWEPQVRWFARTHRCVIYDARGYPPSDVPEDPDRYSQERAAADAVAVLDHLGVGRAHVVGLSMGGFCALHLGLRTPDRALSLVVAGCGYGSHPDRRESWPAETEATARSFEAEGSAATAERYMVGPARVQLQAKDPRAWAESRRWLAEHSAAGSALTLRGVQMRRPSLYDLAEPLSRVRLPVLVVTGDEDEGCLEPNLMLKRTIPTAALAVLPRTGHAVNLEEPALFNRLVGDFIAAVEAGRWTARDPRSLAASLTGMAGDGTRS
ncbi:MAG TPA: alpha/beta fold hydrolase [Candidatus Dormibacteraeota bacterium]|nr:alpha/beta fold hydrolase [Candidatus Dormibacteraeota bacterium]